MKIRVFEDEISYEKTIPFEVEHQGKTYEGVVIETNQIVGGLELEPEYKVIWDDEDPGIDKTEVVELVLLVLKGLNETE